MTVNVAPRRQVPKRVRLAVPGTRLTARGPAVARAELRVRDGGKLRRTVRPLRMQLVP